MSLGIRVKVSLVGLKDVDIIQRNGNSDMNITAAAAT
jgi:hypothetical protein